jgi:hypothetical protein
MRDEIINYGSSIGSKKKEIKYGSLFKAVGAEGFEPPTPSV